MQKALVTRLSISTRLGLWYGLTLFLLLSLFAIFCYTNFHVSVHRDFDRHLTHEQREISQFLQVDRGRPILVGLDDLRSVAYETEGIYGTYVRLLSARGEELYRSPNFSDSLDLTADVRQILRGAPVEQTVSGVWDDNPVRSRYSPVMTQAGVVAGWLEITGFEWSLHQELERLADVLIIGITLSVVLAVAGGFWLGRRALQPVAALTEAANRIGASDLSARLPTEFGVRDELTDLAETFNGMIERLEASFSRERRFSSNAAHELLTPLTTIRSAVDVALRRRREPERYEKTLQAVVIDIDNMSDTVRGLLSLARAEQLDQLPSETVDLVHVTRERANRIETRANDGSIAVHLRMEHSVVVSGNSSHLAEVIDNLLDNALKYTPPGGRIVIEVEGDDREARLRVTDSGIGFSSTDAGQLFDRFYRADTSEVQAESGSGLGLTVVQTILHAYRGSISASSPGLHRGCTFEVRLPRVAHS